MNCEKCISRKVCFVQKQIEGLAEKMILLPFIDKADISGARNEAVLRRYDERMAKWDKVCKGLKGVIASNCSLYVETNK